MLRRAELVALRNLVEEAKLLEACPPEAAANLTDWVAEAGELARTLPADWKRPRAIGAVEGSAEDYFGRGTLVVMRPQSDICFP